MNNQTRPEGAPSPSALQAVIEILEPRFQDRFSTRLPIRDQHARGEGYAVTLMPDAVVWPRSTEEVSAILRACHAHGVPVVAFGAGTSLEGHVGALHGGISIDMSLMDQVVAVNAEDGDCVVQPGITRGKLNEYLRHTGMYFPIDPGADASIGGMIATRASGTTTVLYGTVAPNVMALEVVMADGQVIRCGSRARKSAAGYDLVRLLCGSEGTLGIITEATLRIHGRPETVGSGICHFPDLRSAVEAVIELLQLDAPLARIEFLDEVQVRACNRYSRLDLPEKPTLFIEFNGTPAAVTEQFERARESVVSHGGEGLEWAFDEKQRAQLWTARHNAYFAARALRPDAECIVADVCVPISRLAESVADARAAIDAAGVVAPIVGHVGDGNYHVLFLVDPDDPEERRQIEQIYDAMIATAHRFGGTCTGEHGIGIGKREKLVAEFGEPVVQLMRQIKQAWDPAGILNPGKVFTTR